jgi:hypothetical protein
VLVESVTRRNVVRINSVIGRTPHEPQDCIRALKDGNQKYDRTLAQQLTILQDMYCFGCSAFYVIDIHSEC